MIAGVLLVLWAPWRAVPALSTRRLSAEIGADVSLTVSGAPGTNLALSPDGSLLAFVGQKTPGDPSRLYIRRLDQLQATLLSGTDDAKNPFFSPDGQWVAFFAAGTVKKISVTGGAAVKLCDAPNNRGGWWGDNDTIVLAPANLVALQRVPSAGGTSKPFIELANGETTQRWPQVLPGAKAVLFTGANQAGNMDNADIVVQELAGGARKIVQRGGYFGRYVASGHIIYLHGGTLFAAPFDLNRLELSGQPAPVLEGVNASTGTGGAHFTVSDNGTLAYLSGQAGGGEAPILWMDREGKTTPLRAMPADWSNPQFSPDGTRLAIDVNDGRQVDVSVYEWARDTLTRLTFHPATDVKPVWTPDGRRIVFGSQRGSNSQTNLYWQRADGSGDAQRLTESKNSQLPGSWHPNGKVVAFTEQTPNAAGDLMLLAIEGDEASGWKPGKLSTFLSTPANEQEPMFSPDGRWVAYYSNEAGQNEVYVRPFPGPGGKWQISNSGGLYPMWSRTRRELLYQGANGQIEVASYTVGGDSFRADKPRVWSPGRIVGRPRLRPVDLHPDGNRVALASAPQDLGGDKQDKVVFIFNVFDELRRIAPAHK